jgi:tetratricopeptide (TPR) repeat protein
MEKTNEKTIPVPFSESLVNFIQRYRKNIVISTVAVLGLIIIAAAAVSIIDGNRIKNIEKVENYVIRYDEARGIGDEAKKTAALSTMVDELSAFAAANNGYASARAYMALASIHADMKDWSAAETAWVAAAAKLPKSYLAPVALYNAAGAAEEKGDADKAIVLYNRCIVEFGNSFPLAPRAYLALGRLHEEKNDRASAAEAYKKIVELWPYDNWTKLANSRILFLADKK